MAIPTYEQHILDEIQDVESRITELEQRRRALAQILMRVRRDGVTTGGIHRRNSADRVLVEARVLEDLARATRSMSSRRLFESARRVLYDLKEGTFRSYLHRMKLRGLIENPKGSQGVWRLPEAPPATATIALSPNEVKSV